MFDSKKSALVVGVAGLVAAAAATVVTPAFGSTSASPAPIHSARNNGPVNLRNGDTTLVTLRLPAGRWLVTAKLWADSAPSQPSTNTVVGCHIAQGSNAVDSSAFNIPKVGGANGSSAGMDVDTAVITVRSGATISFQCNDFGSQAVAHEAVLTAIG
jgi:hypothetical protein